MTIPYRAVLSTVLVLAPPCFGQQFLDTTRSGRIPDVRLENAQPTFGDFDGDGDLDLFLSGRRRSVWYRNDGRGNFVDATATTGPAQITDADVGRFHDFDGDGDADLFVMIGTRGEIYANDGSGVFTQVVGAIPATPGAALPNLDIADFDGDGDPDILLGSQVSPALLRNDGNLMFTDVTAASLPPASDLNNHAVGDFDGDGDIEIVGNPGGGDRLIYLENDGAGVFSDVTGSRLAGATGVRLAVGDPDGDGDPDVFAADFNSSVALLVNDGTGFFTVATMPAPPNDVREPQVADVDADGDEDLVFEYFDSADSQVRRAVFRNMGGNVFVEAVGAVDPAEPNHTDWTLGDVDGDTVPDLVLGTASSRGRAVLLLNDGTGVFTVEDRARLTSTIDSVPVFGDLDADGDADLVRAQAFNRGVRVHMNDGTGFFTDESATRAPGGGSASFADVALFDLGADGDLDVAFGPGAVWENDGTGHFTLVTATVMPANVRQRGQSVLPTDIDGDGEDDLLLWHQNNVGQFWILVQDAAGLLQDESAARIGTLPFAVARTHAFDIDNDGDVDLLFVSNSAGARVRAFVNDGTGTFTDETAARVPSGLTDAPGSLPLDWDGDGDTDVIVSRSSSSDSAMGFGLQNDGAGVFTLVTGIWPGGTQSVRDMLGGDIDADGDADFFTAELFYVGRLQLWINDGGSFTDQTVSRIPGGGPSRGRMSLADVDFDGDLDLLASAQDVLGDRIQINRHRQLTSPYDPVIGGPLPLQFHSEPGYGSNDVTGYLLLNFVPAAGPLSTPFGSFLIEPIGHVLVGAVNIPTASGAAEIGLTVPNNPTLAGLQTFFQGVIVDLAGAFPAIALTGLAAEVIE